MAYATGMTLASRSILPIFSRAFVCPIRVASLLGFPEKSSSSFFSRVQVHHLFSSSTTRLFSSVKCSIQSTSSLETENQAVSRPNLVDILEERGLLESITSENLKSACSDPNVAPLKVYCGFDPTAESLHLGNLLGIIVLSWFQRCGHQAVGLIGGATGRVGDPSGKSLERPELDADTLEKNIAGIKNIIVSRCSEREFGSKQWQSLRTKLAIWRDNIANIISTIESNKVTEEGSQVSSSSAAAIQGLTVC